MTRFDRYLASCFTRFLITIDRMSYRIGIHTGMNCRALSQLRGRIRENEHALQRMEGI